MKSEKWIPLVALLPLMVGMFVGCGGEEEFVDPRADNSAKQLAEARKSILAFITSEVAFLKEKKQQEAADYAAEFLETLHGYADAESPQKELFGKMIDACKAFQEAAAGSASSQDLMAKLKELDALAKQLPSS